MDTETLIQTADRALHTTTGDHLNDLQITVLRGTLLNQDYKAIARETGKNIEHIRKIGSKLWKSLSQALNEPITKTNCRTALQRALQSPPETQLIDWGEAPDIPVFFGRHTELTTLSDWILVDRCRLISIIGFRGIGKTAVTLKLGKGGIGKTDLTLKLAQGLQPHFQVILWRSLLNAPRLQDLLTDLIQTLDQHQSAPEPITIEQQTRQLLTHLQEKRCLLILDNAESLLSPTDPRPYRPGYENYNTFFTKLATLPHQSCILLTSREKLAHLTRYEGIQKPVRTLELTGLNPSEGHQIFTAIDSQFQGKTQSWQDLITRYDGNPLALELAAHHIKDSFGGDIDSFLTSGNPLFNDLRDLLDWHCDRLTPPEQELLYWLAIHREPSTLPTLQQDILNPIDLPDRLQTLQQKIPLEKGDRGQQFSLQPVLIEYLTDKLIQRISDEIIHININLLNRYALCPAQDKDYIRETQNRLILQPILKHLIEAFSNQQNLETHLRNLLQHLRETQPRHPGYTAGNLLNLITRLPTRLQTYDFSHLALWQADLQQGQWHQVNFTQATFHRCRFNQAFGGIHALTYSPDGQTLAVGDSDGHIRLLTADGSQQLALLSKHEWWTAALAYSPDGSKIASITLYPFVRLWDVETGQCIHTLFGHSEGCWGVAYSPDGKTIASASDDRTIKLWDVETGACTQTLTGHSSWVLSVAYHPTRPLLLSGSHDHSLKLWDLETGACLQTLTGHTDAVWSVAFHPDGQTIASGGCDRTIRLWDLTTGQTTHTLTGHPKEIKCLAISPDGKTLASACFGPTVRFWDLATGSCQAIAQGHRTGIRTLTFSPDNRTVVTGDNDQILKFWDARNGKCLNTLAGYTNWVWAVAYSPDGKTIASSYLDHSVRLWDVETGTCLQTLTGHTAWIWSIAFSPDGQFLASCGDDETIRLWDLTAGKLEKYLRYSTQQYQGGIWSVQFSLDGQFIFSSGQDAIVKRWNLQTGECIQQYEGHRGWIWKVRHHPTQNIIASSSDDHEIRLWDTDRGQCLKTLIGHQDKVRSLAFSPDGRTLASGSDDGTICLWDTSSGTHKATFQLSRTILFALAFSRCGRYLASGSNDHILRLWDITTESCKYSHPAGDREIMAIDISPDNQSLITGTLDGIIRRWDLLTGSCLQSLTIPKPYDGTNFSQVTGLTIGQLQALASLGAIV